MHTQQFTPMLLVCLWLTWNATADTQRAAPPSTHRRPVTETFFGTKVVDNYRWIEDLKSLEVQGWFKSQNQHTRQVLEVIPGREKLRARIAELDNTGFLVSGLQSFRGRLFYFKQAPGDDNRKLAVEEQLQLESATLEVDQEDLDAANQELIRAGGDPKNKIQQLMDQHEALGHEQTGVSGAA